MDDKMRNGHMICKDCDGPLTTYQGINQRPEDAEVFCAYCEANPPVQHDDQVAHGVSDLWRELPPNEYTDFGTLDAAYDSGAAPTIIGPHNVLLAEEVGAKFYYVEHTQPDDFADKFRDAVSNYIKLKPES